MLVERKKASRTTEQARAFFQSDEYLAWARGGGARGFAPVDAARLKERGLKKSFQVAQRDESATALKMVAVQLQLRFEKELIRLCTQHGLDVAQSRQYFIAPRGPCSQFYSFHREFKHRFEITTKTCGARRSIALDDPELQKLNFGFDVSIQEFICSEKVRFARPSTKPGSCGYTTEKNNTIVYGRDVMRVCERTAYKEQCDAAAAAGTPPPPPPVFPWIPVPAEKMAALAGCVEPFYQWCEHTTVYLKSAQNNKNSLRREIKQADGVCPARLPERDRGKRSRKLASPLAAPPPPALAPFSLPLARAPSSDTPRSWGTVVPAELAQVESGPRNEVAATKFMWEQLGACACIGGWRASVDTLFDAVNLLQDSNAMVFSCDVQYEPANGSRFRSVEDTVSYMDDTLQVLHSRWKDSEGALRYCEANDTFCREYPDGYVLYPYASVFDSRLKTIQVDFRVLHKYYPDLYDDTKTILQHWHAALHCQNGGFSSENAERRAMIHDDTVFGPGRSAMLCECPPSFPSGAECDGARWRLRRPRAGELVSDFGSLDDTPFPLLNEVCVEGLWLVWSSGCFWVKADEVWKRLPRGEDGTFHSLEWVEGDGDDEAKEDHCFALYVPGSMMPETMPLLPAMF